MATLKQLQQALVAAHQAGNTDHARMLAEAIKNQNIPSSQKNTFSGDVVKAAAEGYGGAMNLADRAWSGLAGAAARPFDEEESDRIFREMEQRTAKRSTWKDKVPGSSENMSIPARAFGTALALPAIIPTALASPFESSQEMVKAEPSLGKGAAAIGISSVGSALGFGAPAAVGKSLLTKAATGAGINPLQTYLQSQALQGVADEEATKKKFEPSRDDLIVQAVLGGAMGPFAGRPPAGKVNPRLKDLVADDLSTPKVDAIPPVEEKPSTAMTPSQLKAWKETQDKFAAYKEEQEFAQRAAQAQQAVEARQKALEEQVARQTGLDTNAAERARQEAAPTGYDQWAEGQRQAANTRLPGNNDPLKLGRAWRQDLEQQKLQNALDEQPYRPEGMVEPDSTLYPKQNTLPLEVQDILGRKDEPTLTQQVLDILKSGESPEEMARRLALPVDIQEILRSPHTLPERIQTILNGGNEVPKKKSRGVGGGKRGSPSRGALNLDIFDPFFKREKKLPNGVRLVFTGHSESPEIKAYGPRGNEVGELRLSSDSIYRQSSGDNLAADWVSTQKNTVPDFHAAEMYKFAAEIGNDVVPSKVQTSDGKAMWQGFERKGISNNGRVPRQGGTNFGIMDKLDELVKNNQTLKAVQEITREKFYQERTSPEQTIAEALADGRDVANSSVNFSAGGTMEWMKRRSPLIQGAVRMVQRELAIAEDRIRNVIFPVERAFRRLSRDELADVSYVLRKELLAKKTVTQVALEAGLNEKQLLAYSKLREAFKKTYEEQNAVRKAQGLKEITELEAYVSSTWQGDFRSLIKDANGKTVWALAAPTARGLKAQKKALFKEFPELEKGANDFVMKSSKKGQNAQALYNDMVDLLGRDDPAVQAMATWMEDNTVGQSRGFLNQEKHFEQKGGTRGFIGDRPGMKPGQEAIDFVQAQITYMKNAHQWAALQRSAESIKKILKNEDLQKQQPNNLQYVREYWLNQLGANEHAMTKGFEDLLRDTGYSPTAVYSAVGGVKNLWTTQKLAVNAGFALSNVIQAANMFPHLVDMQVKYGGNVLSSVAHGAMFGPLLATGHVFGNTLSKSPEALYKAIGITMKRDEAIFTAKAMKYAEDNSIVSRSIYDESPIESSFSASGKVMKAVGTTITLPETYLRSITYMTYVHQLKESGKFANEMDIFRMAEERVNMSMGDYRQGERAPIFNKAGIVGNAASTLSTFPINYYNQWSWAAREAGKKNFMPALTMLAIQGYVAGLMGVPGFSDMDKLIEFGKGLLAKMSPQAWSKIKDFGLKEATLALPGGAAITYGSLSEDSGVGVTTRAAAPSPYEMVQTPGAPMVDAFSQAGSVLNAASSGFTDTQKNAQAMYDIAPTGLQGFLETGPLQDHFKVGSDLYKSKDLASRRGQYRRTPEEESLRAMGLRSQKEAVTRDLDYRQAGRQKITMDVIRSIPDKLYNEIRKGNLDKAKDFIELYANLSGSDITKDQIATQIMQEFTSASEKRWTGKQMPVEAVKEAVRLQNLLNQMGYGVKNANQLSGD